MGYYSIIKRNGDSDISYSMKEHEGIILNDMKGQILHKCTNELCRTIKFRDIK